MVKGESSGCTGQQWSCVEEQARALVGTALLGTMHHKGALHLSGQQLFSGPGACGAR